MLVAIYLIWAWHTSLSPILCFGVRPRVPPIYQPRPFFHARTKHIEIFLTFFVKRLLASSCKSSLSHSKPRVSLPTYWPKLSVSSVLNNYEINSLFKMDSCLWGGVLRRKPHRSRVYISSIWTFLDMYIYHRCLRIYNSLQINKNENRISRRSVRLNS